MLYKCNILALVGGGKNPKFPPNKLILWDDAQNKSIGEIALRNNILSVKLRTTRFFKYFCINTDIKKELLLF